jgi:hypothetical protein
MQFSLVKLLFVFVGCSGLPITPSRRMDDSEDTETLLALLCSLLPDNVVPTQQCLLEALLQTEGDVQMAAEIVLKQRPKGKRKRNGGLDSWLTRPGSSKDTIGRPSLPDPPANALQSRFESESPNKKPRSAGPSAPSTTRKSSPPVSKPVKPVKNLLDVLRQPPTSAPASAARLTPLTLSNPSLVVQHTPCTLHLGVLPSELACHLFYTMLHEAKDWSRNKWWLFDRLVESPHRSTMYTRYPVEDGNESTWQGITRAW